MAELRRSVRDAHVLVLATPEYHGGMSGVLKNALDLLSVEHLEGKVAGVISVLGGGVNSNALNDLSRILRCCHAWVIPQHIAIGRSNTVFVDGRISDAGLRLRFEEFAQNLARSSVRLCGLDLAASETHGTFRNLSIAASLQSGAQQLEQQRN